MNERGEYRPIYAVLVHGPDYQVLSPDEKLLLLHCKLNLGAAGIGILYASALIDQTGLTTDQVRLGLDTLAARGWIEHERNVIWVRDGLKYEPSISSGNPKHRTWLANHLKSLPRLEIVDRFRAHYPEWMSRPSPEAPETSQEEEGERVSDRVSDTVRRPSRITTTTTTTSTSTETPVVGGRRATDPDAALALIVAANQGMRDNPAIGAGRELARPIPATHGASVQAAHDLLREVDPDFARAAIYTLALEYKPQTPKDRIHSLGYFLEPVRRQWAEHQAAEAANASAAPGVIPLAPRPRSRPSHAQQTYDTTLAALEGHR